MLWIAHSSSRVKYLCLAHTNIRAYATHIGERLPNWERTTTEPDFGERLQRFATSVGIDANVDPNSLNDALEGPLESLDYLRRIGFYNNQVVADFFEPPRAPQYEDIVDLPEMLELYLRDRRITPYVHQNEVVTQIRAGANVVLSTPTASGKSLAFNLSTFEKLLADPEATALYLYPTKALAHDQIDSIAQMLQDTSLPITVSVYDGDTSAHQRAAIRNDARIIISNPHAMNLYLGWPQGWHRFLSQLKIVIVDESHTYGGVFGSHVALLLRRLRRLVRCFGGAEPQFLLASGTISNPLQHAEKLVGLEFTLVDSDGSARMPRHLVLWDALCYPDLSITAQSALLVKHLVRGRRRVIAFSDSRHSAERLARQASDRSNTVVSYRAGYPARVRRQIESRLREGEIRAISSTSALEVGIDIGSIDTVVLNGYPGSIASLLQRAGRAGRMGQESLVVVVLGEDPTSRFLVRNKVNPFTFPPESAVIEPNNSYVLESQLSLIAREAPILVERDRFYFGPKLSEGVTLAIEKGSLQRSASDETITPIHRVPHRYHSFIVSSGPRYKVIFHNRGAGDIHEEHISKDQALREAYLKAVFPHQGVLYRIKSVDHEKREIHAHIETQHTYTVAQTLKSVVSIQTIEQIKFAPLYDLILEEVRVVDQVLGYKEFLGSPPVEKKGQVKGPSTSFETIAITCQINKAGHFASISPELLFEGLHALEHGFVKGVGSVALASISDISGVSLKGDDSPRFTIYEQTPGGSGVSHVIYERWMELLELSHTIISSCPCEKGCPSCILDATCRESELSKDMATSVVSSLINATL